MAKCLASSLTVGIRLRKVVNCARTRAGWSNMNLEQYLRGVLPGLVNLDIQIILLRDLGLKWGEIATQLGVDPKTVYRHKEKLKKVVSGVPEN